MLCLQNMLAADGKPREAQLCILLPVQARGLERQGWLPSMFPEMEQLQEVQPVLRIEKGWS